MQKRKIFLAKSNNIFEDFITTISDRDGFILNNENIVYPVFFFRYIGYKNSIEEYLNDLNVFEENLCKIHAKYILNFKKSIVTIIYNKLIVDWNNIENYFDLDNSDFIDSYKFKHLLLEIVGSKYISYINDSVKYIYKLFKENKKNFSKTIAKNFILKQLTWIKHYSSFINKNLVNDNQNVKILYYGDIKEHEAYFLIFMFKIGCDIIYINTEKENVFDRITSIDNYSEKYDMMKYSKAPNYSEKISVKIPLNTRKDKVKQDNSILSINTSKSDYKINTVKNGNSKINTFKITSNNDLEKYDISSLLNKKNSDVKEKDFEEIAKLSISVVLIKSYDIDGNIVSGGSGVVISDDGIIVTTYYVVSEGTYFKVLFENSDNRIGYETYTVLHKDINREIAILKINKPTKGINICTASGTVRRGQKIVSIGSPFGLINTISDGIISGFRDYGKRKYIQNTAPSSPGSTGGALINKKGELIGIMMGDIVGVTTEGYYEGQNLNISIDIATVIEILRSKNISINYTMLKNFSEYSYDSKKIVFDGFFGNGQEGIYDFYFYQNRQDETKLAQYLTQNSNFKNNFENYYKNFIPKFLKGYNINSFNFGIGSENLSYVLNYDNGILASERWKKIRK
ncbi:MAG: YceG family protein [Clostridiales bacterium]